MHRIQFRLEHGQHERLRARACRERTTMSSLIRRAVDEFMGGTPERPEEDEFRTVIGIGAGDGAPVAENYEDYLYPSAR